MQGIIGETEGFGVNSWVEADVLYGDGRGWGGGVSTRFGEETKSLSPHRAAALSTSMCPLELA